MTLREGLARAAFPWQVQVEAEARSQCGNPDAGPQVKVRHRGDVIQSPAAGRSGEETGPEGAWMAAVGGAHPGGAGSQLPCVSFGKTLTLRGLWRHRPSVPWARMEQHCLTLSVG